MTEMEFAKQLAMLLEEACEVEVSIDTKTAENDVEKLILFFDIRDCKFGFNVDAYYEEYNSGTEMDTIVREILRQAIEGEGLSDAMKDVIKNYSKIKDYIYPRLISKNSDKFIESVVSRDFLDMRLYYVIQLNFEPSISITVKEPLLKDWRIDEETLYDNAYENIEKLTYSVRSLLSFVPDFLMNQVDFGQVNFEVPMYVIQNEHQRWSATALMVPDLLSAIADKFESDILIIPSSVHELIILSIPDEDAQEDFVSYTRDLIQLVNSEDLKPDEVLSDHPYLFHRDNKNLTW